MWYRPNSIVCTVLKASSWFCCRSYDFSELHVQLTAVEFTHMLQQAMEEDHNSWIRVTKHVSFVLCQATYKVGLLEVTS